MSKALKYYKEVYNYRCFVYNYGVYEYNYVVFEYNYSVFVNNCVLCSLKYEPWNNNYKVGK